MLTVLTIIAAAGAGLMGGLFFAFSNFVMKALGQLSPSNGITAMQAINRTVLNPLFLGIFMMTAAISVFLILNASLQWFPADPKWFITGGLFYFTGSFLVTIFFNVPLNNRLESADTYSPECLQFWPQFIKRWTAWNHVRTLGALGASVSYLLALL